MGSLNGERRLDGEVQGVRGSTVKLNRGLDLAAASKPCRPRATPGGREIKRPLVDWQASRRVRHLEEG